MRLADLMEESREDRFTQNLYDFLREKLQHESTLVLSLQKLLPGDTAMRRLLGIPLHCSHIVRVADSTRGIGKSTALYLQTAIGQRYPDGNLLGIKPEMRLNNGAFVVWLTQTVKEGSEELVSKVAERVKNIINAAGKTQGERLRHQLGDNQPAFTVTNILVHDVTGLNKTDKAARLRVEFDGGLDADAVTTQQGYIRQRLKEDGYIDGLLPISIVMARMGTHLCFFLVR